MAAAIGLRGAITSGGLLCVGAVRVLAAVLPRFTAYDERTSPHGQSRDAAEPAPAGQLGTKA